MPIRAFQSKKKTLRFFVFLKIFKFFHLVIFSYLLSQMFCIATFISVNHMLHFHIHLNEVVSYKTQSIRNSDRTESQKMLLMKIFVSWTCISRGSVKIKLVPAPTKRDQRNQQSMIQIVRFPPLFNFLCKYSFTTGNVTCSKMGLIPCCVSAYLPWWITCKLLSKVSQFNRSIVWDHDTI